MAAVYNVSPKPNGTGNDPSTATLAISPLKTIGPPPSTGQTFAVNVTVQNVTDLFTYDVTVNYDPTVLQTLPGTSGNVTFISTWFKGSLPMSSWAPGADEASNSLTYGTPGATGSGPLFQVKFNVTGTRPCSTWINISVTALLNSTGYNVPFSVLNGFFVLPKAPVANFTYSPAVPFVNQMVTFNASKSVPGWNGTQNTPIIKYAWNFGDGTNGVGMIANHMYSEPGTHTVILNVTDSQGVWNTNSATITIGVSPILTFSPSKIIGPPPTTGETFAVNLTVQNVTDLFTYDINVSYNPAVITPLPGTSGNVTFISTWFKGSLPLSSWTPRAQEAANSLTYGTPGATGSGPLFQVTFNVTGTPPFSTWINISVTCLLNSTGYNVPFSVLNGFFVLRKAPVANFTYSPAVPFVNQMVTFNASKSVPGANTTQAAPIIKYAWNFGDGTNGVGMIANHMYSEPGTYTVILNVTDSQGVWNTTSATITILCHDVGVINVIPSPTEVTVGENVAIIVVVKNNGSAAETFNVTAYANTTAIGTKTVTNLAIGATQSLTFTWDTAGVAAGSYTIKAVAPLAGDISPGDNVLADGQVKVTPIIDVGVISVTPSPTEVTVGENVAITVVVKNNGSAAETFNVTAYYDTTAIGMQTVTNLLAGSNTTLTFTWDTAGVAAGSYTIKAVAPLAGDISPGDNVLADGQVKVSAKSVTPTWLWITIIAVVVVIIIVAAAYMLTRRKPAQKP
jgi:chitodextrinase/predicted thioesterase